MQSGFAAVIQPVHNCRNFSLPPPPQAHLPPLAPTLARHGCGHLRSRLSSTNAPGISSSSTLMENSSPKSFQAPVNSLITLPPKDQLRPRRWSMRSSPESVFTDLDSFRMDI